MKMLKICIAAISFMVFSVSAHALPMTATLSVDGFVDYNSAGDGDSNLDVIFGNGNWTYSGELNFTTSVVGTPPAFSQNANWYLSGEGGFDYGWTEGQNTGGDSGGGSFGPLFLGHGSADDVFNVAGYGAILPALGAALSGTPTLTEVIMALNGILEPAFALPGALPSFITDIFDNIHFAFLGGNTVGFVSDLPLTIDGATPTEASAVFGGNLTLTATAVPEPGMLGLLGFGLIGIAVMARRKRLVA